MSNPPYIRGVAYIQGPKLSFFFTSYWWVNRANLRKADQVIVSYMTWSYAFFLVSLCEKYSTFVSPWSLGENNILGILQKPVLFVDGLHAISLNYARQSLCIMLQFLIKLPGNWQLLL